MKSKQICLTAGERKELEQFAKTGVRNTRLVARANVVLALDTCEGRKAAGQADIVQGLGVSRRTVITARDAFLEAENVAAFLQRKKRATPPVKPKMDGQLEARIIPWHVPSRPRVAPGGPCACSPTHASNCGMWTRSRT